MLEKNDFWEKVWDDIQDDYKEKDGNLNNFNKEINIIKVALFAIVEELESKKLYKFKKFFTRGGAGLLFIIIECRSKEERILKIPRPLDEELIESVKNESILLKELKHRNIMHLFDLGDILLAEYYESYPYFIMKYLKPSLNIKQLIEEEINNLGKHIQNGDEQAEFEVLEENLNNNVHKGKKSIQDSSEKRLDLIMEIVIKNFYSIAKAIQYLHSKDIVHYDIKPDNIMIDKSEKDNPLLSDLGYAKKVINQTSERVIGFTSPYAHLELLFTLESKESINRNRASIELDKKHKLFDIFSFGKTILEILKVVGDKFEDIVGYNYNFMYIHLAACRMLDGRNLSEREKEGMAKEERGYKQPDKFYKETWMDFDKYDLEKIQYVNFDNIVFDFEKILNERQHIFKIPELKMSHPERIQSNYNEPAPFSKRVERIINHPLFNRLIHIPQLGILHTVYPTATHSRFEHSIGTYRNCCLYIRSLYNDPYNPLFKQLVNNTDIKSLMLAALLHDLGHFPLAHEFEEAINSYVKKTEIKRIERKLDHEQYTIHLLKKNIKDYSEDHLTLKEIIEKYWQVDLKNVLNILEKKDEEDVQDLKQQMLHSIIDGPIDVDKLDWLQRDSHNCYLKYGDLIDEDRLIRTLSVIIKKKNSEAMLIIGVYEKGQTAAESFAFGRYLLYQSLYWHRTARAIRAMLNEAIIPAILADHTSLPPIVKKYIPENDLLIEEKILRTYKKQDLIEYSRKNKIKINTNARKEEIFKVIINKQKSITKLPDYMGFDGFLDTLTEYKLNLSIKNILTLIEQCTNEVGKKLIEMIKKRNYYKRIYTIHKDDRGIYKIFTEKVANNKKAYQKRLAEELKIKFKAKLIVKQTELKKKGRSIESITLSDDRVSEVEIYLEDEKMLPIICDAPPEILGGKEFLRLIPEPYRHRDNYENRTEIGSNISTIYNNIYKELMQQSSKGRIFCIPKIRDSLLHLLKPKDIMDCVRKAGNL